MSSKINVKHAFGINTKIKNSIIVLEEHNVMYVCGHQVVVLNTDTKDQQFISGTVGSSPFTSLGISAIACNTAKKTIAVAEMAEPIAMISLYDSQTLRKRKVLQPLEVGCREIRCMTFSSDGRFLVTQYAGPNWNLALWSVEKTIKTLATFQVSLTDENPVHQVSVCPWDSNVVVAIGRGVLRILRFSEGNLRPVSINLRREPSNFISLCWVPEGERLLLGSEGGEIILLEGFEFRALVHQTAGETPGADPPPIHSLCAVAKGFVAGSSNGDMLIFSVDEDCKEQYRREEKAALPRAGAGAGGSEADTQMQAAGITAIVSTVDDCLLCCADNQQLYSFAFGTKDGGGTGFEFVLTGFHAPNVMGDASITGIDVALWKNIAATCGSDSTVRIWNIPDKKIDICKSFNDVPLALSLHPSGLYVVIAFTEKVKLASILLDDISVNKEFNIRGCTDIKFSRGGNYFAAANGANVCVFNTFSFALVSTLRGHTARVRSLNWLHLDSRLMTVGQEGNVYVWNAFTGARSSDAYLTSVPISAGSAVLDGTRAFTVSNEKMLKEIPMTRTTDSVTGLESVAVKQPKDILVDRHISCMSVDDEGKMLYMGTHESDVPGSLLSIMISPGMAGVFDSTPLHSPGPVTALCVAKDSSLVLTGDCNGCLIISEVAGLGGGRGGGG